MSDSGPILCPNPECREPKGFIDRSTWVVRFRENPIVTFLLDEGPFGMNDLALRDFAPEDREQFAMLIGYSVSGFSELSYVSDRSYRMAVQAAEVLTANQEGNMKPQDHKHWPNLNEQERESVQDLAKNTARTLGVTEANSIGYAMVSLLADSHESRGIGQ